ncbi:hypothetical protein Taro_045532 [Colocasia esculenta]|uniref:Uncharacterized protein n=1 Tax=Colocasia esculenta TaxID=4460 RepID=A0A843X4Y9_COLES|nr:hypothetical protein [Colocasia esculenta]
MDHASGEYQSGSAVREKGEIRIDQGIPISSDLGSSDLSKAIGRHLVYGPNQQQLGSALAGPSTSRPEHSRNILK